MKSKILLYFFLCCICLLCFFYGLGEYSLLDIDETRYVDMAKKMLMSNNYSTLYLNGEYFFEKPPLFFWLECLSFNFFGSVSEFTSRFPIVLLSLLPSYLLFIICKKVKDYKFAIISLLILFTSLEYIFMTKMAILDSVFTSLTVSSIISYFFTFYVEYKNKKFFWCLTYIFSGLAVLAKGIPGIIIPTLIIIISSFIFKSYKETLKYSWGIFLFLIIVLPWHLIMIKMYGSLFFDEYIIKHHILRFLGSEIINRTQPWYFYIVTILWGFFPHIFIFLAEVFKYKNYNLKDDYSKFIVLNLIAFLSILIFFSASGAKLITYILPVYPFISVLAGSFWIKYIDCNDKTVNFSLLFLNILLTVSIIGLFLSKFILPSEVYIYFEKIQFWGLIIFIPFVIFNWIFIFKQKRFNLFLCIVLFMAFISGIMTQLIYKFNYNFGQNDLMKYAKIAKDGNYTISTYMTGVKYSLLYYGNQRKIEFKTKEDINWINKELAKTGNILIIRNKYMKNLPVKVKEKGVKYSLIERLEDEK